jgi:hypothetical protein
MAVLIGLSWSPGPEQEWMYNVQSFVTLYSFYPNKGVSFMNNLRWTAGQGTYS